MTRDDVLRYLLETGEGSYARGMLKLAEFIGLHPGAPRWRGRGREAAA